MKKALSYPKSSVKHFCDFYKNNVKIYIDATISLNENLQQI